MTPTNTKCDNCGIDVAWEKNCENCIPCDTCDGIGLVSHPNNPVLGEDCQDCNGMGYLFND